MAGFSGLGERSILDAVLTVGSINLSHMYLGLIHTMGDESGGSLVEVSGPGYGRTDIAGLIASASGSGPGESLSNAAIFMPPATGNWTQAVGAGLWDDLSGGNLWACDYLGLFPWQPFTNNVASPVNLKAPAHGLLVNDIVAIIAGGKYGGVLPTFSQSSFARLLTVAHVPDANHFDVVDDTSTAVNTSSDGSGMLRKVNPVTILVNQQYYLLAGNLMATQA